MIALAGALIKATLETGTRRKIGSECISSITVGGVLYDKCEVPPVGNERESSRESLHIHGIIIKEPVGDVVCLGRYEFYLRAVQACTPRVRTAPHERLALVGSAATSRR